MGGKMRRRFKPSIATNYEFELDLAPLLAVMVKLVPVLLVSSAFMQVMTIETDLPQAVKEAVQKQDDVTKKTSIQLDINKTKGIKVILEEKGKATAEMVPNLSTGTFDLMALNKKLVEIKLQHPEVYRIELAPEGNVSYKELVKIMDEARRSRDKETKFPVFDSKLNKEVETDYMFPDVVFANMMEG
jgi:biopolymer transport protein ExbD